MPEYLDFSSSLYTPSAIYQTVAAYEAFVQCEVNAKKEGTIRVHFESPSDTIPDIVDHFANHALQLSIIERRESAQ